MEVIGFSGEEVLAVYQLLSAILNLGNIEFVEYTTSGGIEAVSIAKESGKYQRILKHFSSLVKREPLKCIMETTGKVIFCQTFQI